MITYLHVTGKVIPKVKDELYLEFVVFLEKFCFREIRSPMPWCLLVGPKHVEFFLFIYYYFCLFVLVKSVYRQYSSMI